MSIKRTLVIEPKKGWQFLNIREIIQYKDLFYMMVLRDVTVQYKQTLLGFAWAVLNPLLTMIVFSFIFGYLGNMPSDGSQYPLFAFVAIVPWTYFSQSLLGSTNSLISSASLLTKVYFPRLIIPLTPIFAKLADFFIALCMMLGLMLFYNIVPSYNIIFLPLLILLMVLTSAGAGLWLSALAIQYRDVRFAVNFFVQMLMFLAPVVWSGAIVPEKFRLLYGLYPMVGVIEGFRSAFLGKAGMPWDYVIVGTLSGIIIFVSGSFYFRRTERKFADLA